MRFVVGIPVLLLIALLSGCTSVEVIESPRTAYVPDSVPIKEPAVIWTSRTIPTSFEYLGQVKVRSWTYEGALSQLIKAGGQLRADAITDVHFHRVGFLKTMQAFAIKFK